MQKKVSGAVASAITLVVVIVIAIIAYSYLHETKITPEETRAHMSGMMSKGGGGGGPIRNPMEQQRR